MACVASVSVRFRSKETPRKGIFGFGRPKNETRAKDEREERGRGMVTFLPHPLPALKLLPVFARSLTLVPRSLLRNRTETLATQTVLLSVIPVLVR